MNRDTFQELAAAGYNRIPVLREVLADTETPLSTFLKLGSGAYSYFFESVQGGEKWGRYSIIGLPCHTVLRYANGEIRVEQGGTVIEQHKTTDPFAFIESFQSQYKVAQLPGEPRFSGGLVGYFGYDTVRYVETKLGPGPGKDDIGTPDILLMLSEELVVFDNLCGTISFIINADPQTSQAYERTQTRLDELQRQLREPAPSSTRQATTEATAKTTAKANTEATNKATAKASTKATAQPRQKITERSFYHHFPQAEYEQGVQRIKDYIIAGDVMQVVLAQRMSVPFTGNPMNIYRALRYLNPSPYMVYFNMADHHVVSASPEILARVENGHITVRPLAGTRRRGTTEEEDQALEAELLADSKELAEHLMLIDLSRNDSGRVSVIGSVRVPQKMFVERYSHVMHIASIVESQLHPDKTALDVLQATLPVGTLSGAPKVRAMEIIDELETDKRGIYGGAMGYLGWHNNMDMAIAIRTAVISKQTLYVQAGAGIVADSQPDKEWEETQTKARAIVRAVQLAEKGLDLNLDLE
ncbi:MAG: anthranilate synthase component I family protein [Pseudohongiellaceae bacterium]